MRTWRCTVFWEQGEDPTSRLGDFVQENEKGRLTRYHVNMAAGAKDTIEEPTNKTETYNYDKGRDLERNPI
jgi:hypothetical protein